MTVTTSFPLPSCTDDRYVVLTDPCPGTIVELGAGSQLAVRFRTPLGASRWQVTGLPGHVLPLAAHGAEFQFLVFGHESDGTPLRFERRHPDREVAHEVCELLVLPVSAAARTSRSASSRTA
ncbi:hypothetical protein G5V58_22730 [Nocardioides anomalus]|uniref:Uncharacterized protein n=1 Tax=Nocardioides anomalus TaxID=2712223 RepID=A0A6G6WIY0_9ACTN|nr:hypothetical protein [Nocardioides anomalus]QIG45204.1 hypothetical protein G5V58_22730 [Nocardioides anomalus]